MTALFTDPLMLRAIIAAVLVGATAPVVGTFLVQRRLALLGDGIGHVALTGVAVGWLVGSAAGLMPRDALAVPGAIIFSILGALAIEVVRWRGRTSADLALALLFYGGIALGALLIKAGGGTNANLVAYLFGSVSTVSASDVWLTVALSALVLAAGLGLGPALFAVAGDEDFAKACGLPVRLLSATLAAMAALTVTVSMRVVGLLLVSALMIVPVAVAQLIARSFKGTMTLACALGAAVALAGLVITYYVDLPPGATIVVLAVAIYAVTAASRPLWRRRAPAPATPSAPPATPAAPPTTAAAPAPAPPAGGPR
jgi:zinc transport system permease protein